jgi:hypothetical protein
MFACRVYKKDKGAFDTYFDLCSKEVKIIEENNGRFIEQVDTVDFNQFNTPTMLDSKRFFRFFLEILNGFCYMLSEIKPKSLKVLEEGKQFESSNITFNLNWNEIPITKVDYIEGNDQVGGELKVSYGSGEKSPHVRRGHWRNMIRKDGTSYKKWIDQVMVREDKLTSDDLKGNVTLLREKRVLD